MDFFYQRHLRLDLGYASARDEQQDATLHASDLHNALTLILMPLTAYGWCWG